MESANDWAHFLADMAKGQKNISTLNIFKSETENNVDNINDMMKTKTTEEENIYANDNMDELKIIEHNKSDEGGGGSEEEEYYILPNKGKIWSEQKGKKKFFFFVQNNRPIFFCDFWCCCWKFQIFPGIILNFKTSLIARFFCHFTYSIENCKFFGNSSKISKSTNESFSFS